MKKQINYFTWEEEYINIIQSHHEWNSPGISLEDFLLLSDKEKTKIILYYQKESLLSSIKKEEMIKADLHILPCTDNDLCNFLKIEKEEKLTPQDVRESLDKVLKELRELKELTKNISKLETESLRLQSLYIELLEQEDKEIENKLWENKMKTFKENILCQ